MRRPVSPCLNSISPTLPRPYWPSLFGSLCATSPLPYVAARACDSRSCVVFDAGFMNVGMLPGNTNPSFFSGAVFGSASAGLCACGISVFSFVGSPGRFMPGDIAFMVGAPIEAAAGVACVSDAAPVRACMAVLAPDNLARTSCANCSLPAFMARLCRILSSSPIALSPINIWIRSV